MSAKKMLIDGGHAEETRVVIVNGNRLEDFDVEVESRRQLKGNIYLAKVTRVEPSLQAAFVDFGGNRHGFLAFNEIHPDYYQIPVADRAALIEEEQVAAAEDADDHDNESTEGAAVETVGGDDAEEEAEVRRAKAPSKRNYKIQEVIKRRQILLVQVVKEERGNKGAALTTYISLPGRYCVLMPNTARGGGVSRKISNGTDRRKLKTYLKDMDIPGGMAVIVRTAGAKRTKAEIKRDYEYLLRLWTQIRDTTMESIAPCLIYEEGNLIKRAIRDLYTKDIDEIIIEGNDSYRMAKDFMKLLIPSHAKRVQPYKEDDVPLFHRHQIESQLDAMHDNVVPLRSGGYLVLNQTEALVAVDVNSGKATRERNIEETALNTNLEAAEEIARQLRLRDLAGLVVIDFIDMEVNRNNTKVERQLKDAMKSDRARIQIGRISPFGLLELSRQRLRPSLMETSSEVCSACGGTGHRRSVGSAALSVLRAIEEEAFKKRSTAVTVYVASEVALYILNHKRSVLSDIEQKYELSISIEADDSLVPPDHRMERETGDGNVVEEVHNAESRSKANASQAAKDDDGDGSRGGKRRGRRGRKGGAEQEAVADDENNVNEDGEEQESNAEEREASDNEESDDSDKPKRRRGRRGGRRRSRKRNAAESDENISTEDGEAADAESADQAAEAESTEAVIADGEEQQAEAAEEAPKKKRTRRSRKKADKPAAEAEAVVEVSAETSVDDGASTEDAVSETPEESAVETAPASEPVAVAEPEPIVTDEPVADDAAVAEAAKTTVIVVGEGDDSKPDGGRRGWWRR